MADLGSVIGGAIGAGAIIGSAIAAVGTFRKTGSEKTGLLVDAAQDVVIIQKGLMADLQTRLDRAEDTINKMRFLQSEVEALRLELQRVTTENEALKRQLTAARKRIKHLEDINGTEG